MKIFKFNQSIYATLLATSIFGIAFTFQSCIPLLLMTHDANPKMEHDDIKGVTRYKSILHYNYAVEYNSFFSKNEQHIYKEIKGQQNRYKVYDYLQLDHRLNYIEDTIYYIVDGNAYPIQISSQQSESVSDLYKDEEDIILADSSKTTVIKDYEIVNYTNLNLQYEIDEDLVHKKANATEAKIRYYAPPEMITLKLSNLKLKTYKTLAHSKIENKNNKSKYIYN